MKQVIGKRFLSCFAIILCLCTVAVPCALATGGDMVIEAESTQNSSILADWGNALRFYNGNWAEYEVSFLTSGEYEISLTAAAGTDDNSSVGIWLDGACVSNGLIAPTGGFTEYVQTDVPSFNVYAPGLHTIKITVPAGNISLDKFILKRLGDVDIILLEAEVFDENTGGIVRRISEGNEILLLSAQQQAVYLMPPVEAGYYEVVLLCASNTAWDCELILNEDLPAPASNASTASWNEYVPVTIAVLDASAGQHTLTLRVTQGEIAVDKIELRKKTSLELAAVQNGNEIVASVANYSRSAAEGTLICTLFQGGELKEVWTDFVYCQTSETLFFVYEFTEALPEDDIKVFLWDGLSPLAPLVALLYEPVSIAPFKEYYVSPHGSDQNSGEEDAPFATLARALDCIAQLPQDWTGDVIANVLPGTYPISDTLSIDERFSGQNGFKTVIRGTDADDKPVFSGGMQVSGWENDGGGIWSAPLSITEARNLYVNGFPAQRARSGYLFEASGYYYAENSEYAQDGVTVSGYGFSENLTYPADAELVWLDRWSESRTPVAAVHYDDGLVAFELDQPYFSYVRGANTATVPEIGSRFYLENDQSLLDEPGEFYYNKIEEKVYYHPFEQECMSSAETWVPATEGLLEINAENLVLEGLDFRLGAWNTVSEQGLHMQQADYAIVGGEAMQVPGQVFVASGQNIEFKNCSFFNMGSAALRLGENSQAIKIEGCVITDCSGSGIIVGDCEYDATANIKDVEISNSVIARCGLEYKSSCGISVYYANGVNITHNAVSDLPYTGISVGWVWGVSNAENSDITVAYNRISNVMCALEDGAHIYAVGPICNAAIYNNVCINSNDWRGGIYTDIGGRFLLIRDNVVSGAVHWLHSYDSGLEDILVLNNHTDAYYMTNNAPEEVAVLNTSYVYDSVWSTAAQEVLLDAGPVQSDYTPSLPVWRTDFVNETPKRICGELPLNGIEAKSYTVGKVYSYAGQAVTLYPQGWVEYEASLPAGEWKLSANGALVQTYPTLVKTYINGGAGQTTLISPTGGWNTFQGVDVASFSTNSEEVCKIKLEITQGYYLLNYLTLEKIS